MTDEVQLKPLGVEIWNISHADPLENVADY